MKGIVIGIATGIATGNGIKVVATGTAAVIETGTEITNAAGAAVAAKIVIVPHPLVAGQPPSLA